jgi:hypothetical protein
MDRDPCGVLSATQVSNLLGTSALGESKDTGIAKTCSWANLDSGSLVTVQLVYAWSDGLGRVYAKKNEGFFENLEPVQGYPVVAYGPSDERSTGRCGVAVGIADNAAFEADATISRSKVGQADACDAARRVADAAVTTLKAGA